MRKISDTIVRLAALQARHIAPSGDMSAARRLKSLSGFGANPGALKAKFYLPDDLSEGAPLVVVLHGCTQSASGYDHHSGWSQLADEAGFALLYPEQQRNNNPNLCFNWFQPSDVTRHSGEALSIRQMIEAMVETHGLDRKRIFVTGLSAGGAMAAAMLASYPDVFAGGAIIAGLAFASAATVPEAFDRMRGHGNPSEDDLQRMLRDASRYRGPWPRISIWQGTSDQTVVASNASAIASQWRDVHQIERAPTHSHTEGNITRSVWCNAAGECLMEVNMIAEMGHGTPIDAARLGAPGPFMLDVGISSTQEIARFFGIASPGKDATTVAKPAAAADPRTTEITDDTFSAHTATSGAQSTQPRRSPRNAAAGVQKVIEEALKEAGLMR